MKEMDQLENTYARNNYSLWKLRAVVLVEGKVATRLKEQ